MEEGQDEHPGPGELDEFAIMGHPRLERSSPPPWHEFAWEELFERLDGEAPKAQSRERVAQILCNMLHIFGKAPEPRARGPDGE